MSFDENKSQASMPRLYEHIGRVDLWIMAQKQIFESSAEELHLLREELRQIKAERDRVASGKLECADCGAVLARF